MTLAPADDSWSRVSAVLEQLVAGSEAANMERQRCLERGEAAAAELHVPTLREVRTAMLERFGKALSFRDLGPLVARYAHDHGLTERRAPRPSRARPSVQDRAPGSGMEERVRQGVDQALSVLASAKDALSALLVEEVAHATAASREQAAAAHAEASRLTLQLAETSQLSKTVKQLQHRLQEALDEASLAEERLLEAENRRCALEADKVRLQAELAVRDGELKAAAESLATMAARREELFGALDRLSAEFERAGREREQDRQTIADLRGKGVRTSKRR